MINRFLLLILFSVTGCVTQPGVDRGLAAILPPAAPIRYLVAPKAQAVASTHILVAWDACGTQKPGVWYRIYRQTADFQSRVLYTEVTNVFSVLIPTEGESGFFTVVATDGLVEVNEQRCQ